MFSELLVLIDLLRSLVVNWWYKYLSLLENLTRNLSPFNKVGNCYRII